MPYWYEPVTGRWHGSPTLPTWGLGTPMMFYSSPTATGPWSTVTLTSTATGSYDPQTTTNAAHNYTLYMLERGNYAATRLAMTDPPYPIPFGRPTTSYWNIPNHSALAAPAIIHRQAHQDEEWRQIRRDLARDLEALDEDRRSLTRDSDLLALIREDRRQSWGWADRRVAELELEDQAMGVRMRRPEPHRAPPISQHEQDLRRIAEERAANRKAADDRALRLLLTHLDEEQKKDFEATGGFVVIGQSGRPYRINCSGISGNIQVLSRRTRSVQARLCAHMSSELPAADHYLAQKTMLELAEDDFLRIANRS